MFRVNNIYRGLLTRESSQFYFHCRKQHLWMLSKAGSREMAAGIRDKTTRSSTWLAGVDRIKDRMVDADFQTKHIWELDCVAGG